MRLGIRIDRRETTEDTKRRVPPARGRLGLRVKGSAVALKGFHPGEARDARGRWTEGPDTGGLGGGAPNQVRHEGEYVLTSDGKKDFGEIKAETGLPEGKIRLRIGKEEGVKGDYGEKHLERPDRLAQIRQNGYDNAHDLVEFVASGYDAVFRGRGNAVTIARSKNDRHNSVIYVALKAVDDGEFYDVTSGIVSDKRHLKNKRPLWEKPQSGL